ncbi:MAG: hypothetical protein JWP03_4635, partial [Phycisphaerales bacterium]|nr:hypothetical protein [Phycisphaerales bacterium]
VITHVYANAGPETITATVTDPTNPAPNGFKNVGTLAITVNPPPTVPLTGSAAANLNGIYTLTVNPANDPFQSPTNYLIHWGDGSTTSLLAPSTVNHVFTASGADNITVDLTDGTGTFLSAGSLPITVGAGPTVAVSGNPVANAGGIYTLNFGTASDPGGVVSGYSVHWGDGTTSPVAAGSATTTHTYSALGAKTISIDLTDGTGTYSGAGGMSITVSNPSVPLSGKSVTVQGITYVLTVNPATDLGGTPSGYLVHWGDGSTTPLASSGPTSHAYASAGNYLITTDLTDSTGTFAGAGSMALTVSTTPTLSITGSGNTNVGVAYTLNLGPVNDPVGTVSSYLIHWGDGTTTPVTAKTPTAGDGPVTHSYATTGPKASTVDLTDNTGTFASAGSMNVTVNSGPTVALSKNGPAVVGSPFTLTVGPANDPGQVVSGYLIHWGDGSTSPLAAAGNIAHTYASAGPANITVDLTDGTGTFLAAGSLAVTINPIPTVVLTGNAFANATGVYKLNFGTATDANGPVTGYVVNWGDGSAAQTFAASATSATHTYASAGSAKITTSITDATGTYSNAGSLNVTISPKPTLALSGNSTTPASATYTVNFGTVSDPGYSPTGYTIHWGDGSAAQALPAGTTKATHAYTTAGPANITVDLTDATGTYLAAGTLGVTVNATPTDAPTGNAFANAGGTYTLSFGTATDANGPVTGYVVNWGDGSAAQTFAASALTATHTFGTPGKVTIGVGISDATGTYPSAGSLAVTVSPAPTLALSGNASVNPGALYTLTFGALTDPGYAATGYVIHWGDGSAAQNVAAGATGATHNYANPGPQKITVDVADATGTYLAAGTLSLNVNSAPTVVLSGNAFANAGGTYTLTFGTATDANGPVTGYTINWGDGSAPQAFPAATLTAVHTYTTPGKVSIVASIIDGTGTYANAGNLSVTVSPAPTIALSGNPSVNPGSPYTLTLGAVTDPGHTATGYIIHWGDGSVAQSVAAGTTTATHSYAAAGPEKITVDVTDATGTYAAAGSLSVNVVSAPTVTLTGKAFANAGGVYTLTFGTATDSNGPVTSFSVNWGDGSALQTFPGATTTAAHTFATAGKATITAAIIDGTGTYANAGTLPVTISPAPTIALSGKSTTNPGAVYTLTLGAVTDPGYSATGYIIHWGDGSAAQSVAAGTASATHTYSSIGTPKITVDLSDATGTYAAAGTLSLNVAATPTVVLTGNAFANASGTYTLNFGAANDANGPVTGYTINWGDGSAVQSLPATALTATHTYAAPGKVTVSAAITDATGSYANAGSLPVTISPAPNIALSGKAATNPGAVYTLTFGTVTDPGYLPTGYIIHWGDGSAAQSIAAGTASATHTYAGVSTPKITVDISDATGTYLAAGSLSLNVVSTPTVALTGNAFANAGGSYALAFGSATDANGPVTGYLVNWGDGTPQQSFPATTTVATHTFVAAGKVTISASITDATGTYANAGSLAVTVDSAPAVVLSGIATANAGGLYTLKFGTVTDPGYSATGYVVHWGDGSAAQSVAAGTASVTHKYASAAPVKITADLSDATGTYLAAGSLNVTVNPAPTVALSGPSTASTGGSYALTIGAANDPGYAVANYTIHWGDGSAAQVVAAGTTSATHIYSAVGPAKITVDLTDPTGTYLAAGSLPITVVTSAAPSIALGGNANANAGGVYTLNLGTVTDPGQTPTALLIHWGDGSAVQSVAVGTTSVTHKYASPLAAKIVADITDAGGTRAGAGSLNLTVNPPPTIVLTGNANATAGGTYSFTLGKVTDPGYTATGFIVHFGDGSAAVAYPAGTTVVTHKYASPLAAKITVDLTDATGTYLAAGSLSLTVNPTPTIVLSGVSTVNTGTPFTLTLGKVTDPGQTVTGYIVHWGDGATTSLGATATSAVHTYTGAGFGNVKVDIIDTAGTWLTAGKLGLTVTTPVASGAKVVGRYVYYNNSAFDGNTTAATTGDFAAIATDKQALLPGQTATFANYTSFTKGINGIMVDMTGLPAGVVLTAADFTFRTGLGGTPGTWGLAPAPASIVIFRGAGVGGADRVALTWADGSIVGKWLQVSVLATARTGLTAADVFYFGNAPGATGTTTADPMVTAADGNAVLPQESSNKVAIANAFDFNRDGYVNSLDYNASEMSQTTAATALQLSIKA